MQTERPLGLLEKFQASKYFVNCYGAATFTVLFRHPPRVIPATTIQGRQTNVIKQFYLDQLYIPLTRLVKKHPQLSLVLADWNKPTAHFARLPEFDLSAIVHIDNTNKPFWNRAILSDIIASECDHDFDFEDHTIPLWHLHICVHNDCPSECSITLTVNHVIADGASVATFWRELYAELNNVVMETTSILEMATSQHPSAPPGSTRRNDYIIRSDPNVPLFGAYEDRQAPMPTAWDMFHLGLQEKLKSLLPQPLKRYWYPDCWAGDIRGATDKAIARHQTQTRAIEIGGETWQKVCATSKKNACTPHAAIMAAMMTAFAELYVDNNKNDPKYNIKRVMTHTPINCRSICNPPVPQDEFGNFVGNFSHMWQAPFLSSESSSFWEKAKHYYQQLKTNKTQGAKEPGKMRRLIKFPEDYIQSWYDNWDVNPMARSGGIQLSDLGRFIVPESSTPIAAAGKGEDNDIEKKKNATEDPWQIQSIWFSQSSQMMTMALSVTSVSTKDCMYATVTWQKGALHESKIEKFGPLVISALQNACE